MRNMLRSLTFGLATALTGALSAQFPHTLVVQGTIAGCVPFQQVNIASLPGAQPSYNYTLEVFPSACFYDTILYFESSTVGVMVSTQCNGMVVTASDSATFNFFEDTLVMNLDIICGGGGDPDCLGLENGPNQPGTPCDDGDPATINDTWDANCNCIGDVQIDCQASFAITNSSPWVMDLWNNSTGQGSMLYDWVLPDGSTSSQNSPYYVFNAPGTYGVCLTIVAWDQCTSTMCDTVFVDSNGTVTTVPDYYDCLDIPDGSALPGTPCDDGNPQTVYDTWMPGCSCIGVAPGECWTMADWEQVMDSGEPVPFEIMLVASSAGAQPITYSWYFGWPWVLEGTSTTPSWQHTFAPGESMACQVIAVDANGCESQWSNVEGTMTCDGILGSSNWPGLPCTDFFGNVGTWTADCFCDTNTNTEDCLGNPGGGALPGTPCIYTPDSGNTWVTGIWSVDCVCGPDSSIFGYDCLGVWNGPAQPGTPCTVPGTTLEGTWNGDCDCIANNPLPCEANFWVIQAMGPDSLPVPYELWVWNLSSGGSGNFVFTWDFGDGSSSTDAYPTHTYSGNGPYNLCLTIMDNNGCTDTYCDSVSINGDGIYEGLVVHEEDRQDGFTINVQQPGATAVPEVATDGSIATWPNPVTDELNVAVVGGMKGAVTVIITDLEGRVVFTERASLAGDRSQLRLTTSELKAGMYLLRILPADGAVSDGNTNLSQRFVKTN